jgi:hypothetical protein
MMGFLRKPATTVEYEPVAYDRGIVRREDGNFDFILRSDADTITLTKGSLEDAQRVMEMFDPEVFEGQDVPQSVFCPIRED